MQQSCSAYNLSDRKAYKVASAKAILHKMGMTALGTVSYRSQLQVREAGYSNSCRSEMERIKNDPNLKWLIKE